MKLGPSPSCEDHLMRKSLSARQDTPAFSEAPTAA